MLTTAPSVSEVDKWSKAFTPTTASSTPSAATPASHGKTAPSAAVWIRVAPSHERPTDSAAQLFNQLRVSLASYHTTRRSKAFLPTLIAAIQRALSAVEALLREHLPLKSGETAETLLVARFRGELTSPNDQIRYGLASAQEGLRDELNFLRALLQYTTPRGKQLVHQTIFQRYRTIGDGVLMVGLHKSQMHERLDPRHRAHPRLQSGFAAWLEDQMARGENPGDNIIDFLLEIDETNIGPRGRSMSVDRRRSHELKFRKGELHAYYVVGPTGTATRYWNHNHDTDSIPDVRRMEYNSVGGGGEGATDRGGDFVNGDAYVVSHDGKFYSFSGNTVHSEFLSGDPVRAAGIIVSVKGRVQAIDNRSGHYRPGWRNLLQAVEILADQGVFAREAVVAMVVSETSTMFFRVADYIRLGQMGFPFGEATSVVRGYQRKYAGAIPVPESVMPYIPAVLKHGWSNDKGNQWDRFFDHFYMQGRSEMPKDVFDLRPHQDWG